MDKRPNLDITIALLRQFKALHPAANKAALQQEFVSQCSPKQVRSVFVGNGYALRFSEANTGSFSNVVLSLSALEQYDSMPMVICIVRPDRLDFRLANATFLKRISHSSLMLRIDNIRGSFLGHDILEQYEELAKVPENFEQLFALHREFAWTENVARLVETTNAIVARLARFQPTANQLAVLLDAPARSAAAIDTPAFQSAEKKLAGVIEQNSGKLIKAAALENVNLRGNTIEQIITGEVNAHRLDDIMFDLATGKLTVDIKTKLLDRASAPKAYNIDKMLSLLSEPGSVFAFFFVGINAAEKIVRARLISMFDPIILKATRVQTHWAGRGSRGVTQLTGEIGRIFAHDYRPGVRVEDGQTMLRLFLER